MAVVLVLCLVAGAFFIYKGTTASAFLAPRIERVLKNRLQAAVQIQGLKFGLFSGARIAKVEVTPEYIDKKAQEKPSIVFTDVLIRHKLFSLLFGQYRPAKVIIGDLKASLGPESMDWLSDIHKSQKKPGAMPGIEVVNGAMRIDLPVLSEPVQVKNFHFAAWQQAGGQQVQGTSYFNFGGNAIQMEFNAIPSQAQIETKFSIQEFDFSALPVIGRGKAAFDPAKLKISGEVFGTLSARLAAGEKRRPNINGGLTVSGLSARYPGLPFSLEDGFAQLSFTENAVAIRDGACNCAKGGIEVPAACLRFQGDSLECAWIRVNVSRLDVPLIADEQTMAVVPVSLRPEFVAGTASGSFHLQWTPSGGLKYGGDIMVDDVAGKVPKFETEFAELDASINFSAPSRLVIREARAQVLGGRAAAAGTCEFVGGEIKNPSLEFWLDDVTKTDTLVNLLPAVVRDFIGKVGFTSPEVDGLISFQPEHAKVDLSIDGDTAELPDFPVSVDAPHLDVKWASDARRVVFQNVRANVYGSPLEGSGTLNFEQKMHSNISLLGRYLPLKSGLLEWLGLDLKGCQAEGTYDFDLRAQQWWPSGKTSVELLDNMRVKLDLRDVALSHPEAGKFAENINGHVSLDSEGIHLSNMVGDLFGIGWRGSGRLPFNGNSRGVYVQVESENVTLNRQLYDRLPFDIGIEELQLNGQCELKADLQGSGNGENLLSGNVTTILHHIEITPGQTRVSASGTARINISAQNWSNPRIEGAVSLDGVSYGNLDGDRLSADFVYNDRQITIPEMLIGAYGGKIRITETSINTGNGSWQTKAHLTHLDLETLIGAYGVEGRNSPSGVMRGDIRMAGRHMDAETFSGKGTIKISRGRLYSFPLLVSVFNVMDLKMPRWSPVTDAYGDFRIDKGQLMFKDLLFAGGSVPVHMEGKIFLGGKGELKQKPINFIVTVAKQEGVLDQIPLVNWAKQYTLDYLLQLVLQARVEGTFGDYEVTTLSSPLTDPVRKMFFLLEKITPTPPGQG